MAAAASGPYDRLFSDYHGVSKLNYLFAGYLCLKDVALRVPEAARAGDSLTLSCDFSLEQEHLYSVKFYQGDTEFYRYVPQESPPTRVFPIEGVNVDVRIPLSKTITVVNSSIIAALAYYNKHFNI